MLGWFKQSRSSRHLQILLGISFSVVELALLAIALGGAFSIGFVIGLAITLAYLVGAYLKGRKLVKAMGRDLCAETEWPVPPVKITPSEESCRPINYPQIRNQPEDEEFMEKTLENYEYRGGGFNRQGQEGLFIVPEQYDLANRLNEEIRGATTDRRSHELRRRSKRN